MTDADVANISQPVAYWLQQIEASQKWHASWYEEGKDVLDKYLDKRDGDSKILAASTAKMNTLWSNVETIKPALYAKTPTPKVQRRYRDKDPVGRWAAIVLERALTYEFDQEDVDYHVRNAVSDYLLPGRGTCWQYYKPEFKGGGDTKQISWERCYSRHINWKDFLTNPARTWSEVDWVAKRDYLTKEEAKDQGLETKDLVFSEQKDTDKIVGKEGDKTPKAAIWEIWDKTSGNVIFVSKSSPELLRPSKPPPLHFDNFFPVPRPLTTTTATDTIIPRPDYKMYEAQAREIDRLTQKINLLTKALQVKGLYDASQEALGKLLDDSTLQNEMVPCETWAVFAQAGGIEGSTAFLPLKDIIAALEQAYISRDQAKQVMYEVTGISDIVRGATDPNETATAQSLKSQWGGLRIRDRQKETQRFVRDILRINAEIIAEHFQLETLKQMSNCPLLTAQEKQQLQARQQAQQKVQQVTQAAQKGDPQAQAMMQAGQAAMAQNPQMAQMLAPLTMDEQQALREPTWEEVIKLLRDEKLRCMRIDIETDSTINADEVEEKKSRIEFLQATTQFITAMGPVVMQVPKFAPLFGELLMFGTRSFKAADTLESAIEEMVDALSQQALQGPAPPPPDPKIEADKARMAMDDKHHQDTMALDAKKHHDEMAMRQAEMQQSAQVDMRKHEITTQADMAKHQNEMGMRQQEMAHTQSMDQTNATNDMEKHRGEQATKQSVAKAGQTQVTAPDGVFEELAQTIETKLAEFLKGMETIMQAAMAPKSITVQRDNKGRISGAVATPEMASPQGSA